MTLYHASPNKNLSFIEPKRTLSKDEYIGDYVFATADKRLATMYLTTKGVATLMDAAKLWIVIACEVEDYIKNDKGGAIYELPGDTFFKTPQTGLEDFEFVSKEKITPVRETIYQSSIEAILSLGARVYFVSDKVFDELVGAKSKADTVLKELNPYTPGSMQSW